MNRKYVKEERLPDAVNGDRKRGTKLSLSDLSSDAPKRQSHGRSQQVMEERQLASQHRATNYHSKS